MAAEPTTEETGSEALRSRLDALEREHHDRIARANEALAAAQDRSYWLERWGIDLNSLMGRPGAGELRAAMRAARAVYRFGYDLRYRVRDHARSVPTRLSLARQAVEEERALASEPGRRPHARTLSPDPLQAAPVTQLLYERLADDDVASVEERLTPAEQALWETAGPHDRQRLTLAFAAHHELAPALERTGLSSAMPEPGVHAMASGPAAAGGSTYYADLVADSLAATGMRLGEAERALDFGCSSGRVVRVLAAAYPDVDWHGCDPIPDAIEWASANLPGIAFRLSPDRPPLPYDDEAFDAVFAISIWSHFAEQAALDWFAEMRRVLRPGGRLVVTTHGEQTIVHTARERVRSEEQLAEVRAALAEQGFWYAAEFGEAGDHGVTNPDWGTAFLSAEWLLAKLTPGWRVGLFRPGRVELNQDLYVLERA
jgi:SAM-dependent methyltransferase